MMRWKMMRSRASRICGAICCCVFFAGCLISRGSAGRPDWKPLFNAKNLDGWSAPRPELWIVENGMLIGRSPGIKENSFIYTGEKYADFDLRYDVRLVKDEGNSGMQIRSGRRDDGHARGYQVDIGKGYWASLYHEEGRGMLAPFKRAEGSKDDPIKLDQFNHFDVTARGHHLTVKVNGVITVDLEDEMGEETGFIAPQIHAGGPMEVQFKNIDIRVYEKGK